MVKDGRSASSAYPPAGGTEEETAADAVAAMDDDEEEDTDADDEGEEGCRKVNGGGGIDGRGDGLDQLCAEAGIFDGEGDGGGQAFGDIYGEARARHDGGDGFRELFREDFGHELACGEFDSLGAKHDRRVRLEPAFEVGERRAGSHIAIACAVVGRRTHLSSEPDESDERGDSAEQSPNRLARVI